MIFSNFTGRVAKKAKVIDGVNGLFLSMDFAGEETKSVEREYTIQELQKHNEELQETVNLNKGSMSFMTNYINELEKLIIDDDVEKPKKKDKKKNRKRKRKGKK